jgi:hypothetical protein
MNLRICSSALLAGLLFCSCALADGWGLPNLNPFSKKPSPPTAARVSDGKSGFGLLPKWPSTTKKKTSGPSTWNRMTSSTKSALSKTADAINPWDDGPAAKPKASPSPTGSFNPFSTASAKSSDSEKKSFLPSWSMGGDEEKAKKPRSVNDFLAQPKPDYP